MKYAVIPQIYTIIAFVTSIVLWPFMTPIPIGSWAEGMPHYLIHPLFTLHFSLWVTITIAWLAAFAFSLRSIQKRALKLTEVLGQNVQVIASATFTVMIALSGWVGYSYIYHPSAGIPERDLLWLFRAINGFGSFLLIPAWIITILLGYLRGCSKPLREPQTRKTGFPIAGGFFAIEAACFSGILSFINLRAFILARAFLLRRVEKIIAILQGLLQVESTIDHR